MSEDVRPFEEYKEMIKDMGKEEMIRGLYDLSARVTKQENIIKEVKKYIEENSNSDSFTTLTSGKTTDIAYCMVVFEDILEILDKEKV